MKIHNIFGIEPVGKAALHVTDAAIEGVSSFLNAVCKPGLEELGFLIKDKVRFWRLNNILKMLDKAKGKLNFDGKEFNLCANARVGLSIMECCSEVDNDELQNLWAGLFASSCTPDGHDDSNMNFVDLLRRMSSVEAKILDYACINCQKTLYPNGLIMPEIFTISFVELTKITGINDVYRLDCELDHMRSMDLLISSDYLISGFDATDEKLEANLTLTALALNLYFKTHSIDKTPKEFWADSLILYKETEN